jgi:type IV pilus assembly protein PilP
MNAHRILLRGAILAFAAAGLSACGSDMDDLDAYINQIKARPGGRIEPLPEVTPYEVFAYIADNDGVRSPFMPETAQGAGPGSGPRPDDSRPKEYLEQFSLDTLNMVGTMNVGETAFGLVQTSDGLIHRVVPGNYLGQNDGRIVDIDESKITIVEIISDGIGGYVERDAAVSLSD